MIETLIHQGIEIRDYRTKEVITLEDVLFLEREHLHEISLGGPDIPANCRYSLKASHHIVTNGTKATTAGSSKHRISKANRIARGGKVVRRPMRAGARKIPRRPW